MSLLCQQTGTCRASLECVKVPSPAEVCLKPDCCGTFSVVSGRAGSERNELSWSIQQGQAFGHLVLFIVISAHFSAHSISKSQLTEANAAGEWEQLL